MNLESLISICLGIGLAASVGFRVFLPLFALSLASYFNVLDLNDSWQWMGSLSALLILGVATIVEIFAYFIPYIDNLLDSIAVPLAAVAGTSIMLSTIVNLSPEVTWALAIIAGGGTAAAISGTSSATRLASTVTTAGIGNPVISTIETGTSLIITILSFFLPVLAFLVVVFLLFITFRLYKKFRKPKVNNL